MRTRIARTVGVALSLGMVVAARDARATSVLEVPDNGSEQMGRGGAWVARASDPLAAFYNPAGLAGQQTRLTLQANINIQKTCFTRLKAANDATPDTVDGQNIAPGTSFPKVCSDATPFPNPQIAFAYRLSDRVGLGFAVLGPSAAGNQNWPDDPATPNRYLLITGKAVLLTP